MSETILVSLAGIALLGMGAQWLAWRLKLPSILFLLVFGFLAGPVTGLIDPDALFGDLLLPVVSISVAVILFEGGLTLRLEELREIGGVVLALVTLGAAVTWVVAAGAAHVVLGLEPKIAVLLGAVLVVTGPTVIGPLLRHIRPTGKVADILKWEGIVIDPIGALLAVLVFEAILAGEGGGTTALVVIGVAKTLVFGGLIGFAFGRLLLLLFRRFWIPDYLHEAVTLALLVGAFVLSNHVQAESGLLAVTLMGLVLDNQKHVTVKHIVDFKENLSVLIISTLFILLSARLDLSQFSHFSTGSLLFLGLLVFVARPASVLVSTVRSDLGWREKLFLSWMAPRGIVAAAVASIFALRLSEIGTAQADALVPITFMVIVCTVAVYGITSTPLARRLGLAQKNPQGVLFVGANPLARAMAKSLQEQGFDVGLVDTNRRDLFRTRMEHLPATFGDVLSPAIFDDISFAGIGRVLAVTANDELNSLAGLHFNEVFERKEIYQLPLYGLAEGKDGGHGSSHLRGRFLFGLQWGYAELADRIAAGAVIKATRLSETFDYPAFQVFYGGEAVPLFIVTKSGALSVVTSDAEVKAGPGETIVALVEAREASPGEGSKG